MALEKPNLVIYGRVIALSQVQEIPSREAGKPAMKKQELYLDCTREDSITHERIGLENKPLLEFGGDKVLEKLSKMILVKDDVVCVKFAIQGNPYKDEKTGKTKVFTAIRCYDIDLIRKADGTVVQQPVQAAPAPQPEPAPAAQSPFVGEGENKNDLPF